jgi:ABC-type polysaccharide/polyol phosphate transport system ATPase subunit
MPGIQLRSVQAEYQLLSVRDYNLKRSVFEAVRRRAEPVAVIRALTGIDLDVPRGSRLGLVGANGAGKSTLLAVMAGLLPPTSGSVQVTGRVLALLGNAGAGLDQEATGRQNIVSMGVQLGESPATMKRAMEDVVDFSGLGSRIDHPVYSYSMGMQSRLRFSLLTSMRPDVLLIDEGIAMADAEFSERAGERLEQFVTAAGILVLATHGEETLRRQCDSAIWLDRGAIMHRGDIGDVLAAYRASYQTVTS